jgi:hypothetical protein
MNFKPVTATLFLLAATVSLQAQDRSKNAAPAHIQTPVQGMTSTPVQGMTNTPVQGMTSSPVTGMGVGVLSQKSSTVIEHPQNRKAVAPDFVLIPGETTFVSDGTMPIGNDPNQGLGASLSTPGLPTVSLNPETLAQPIDPPGTTAEGTSIEQSVRTTETNIASLEPGTPQEKVIEKFGNPVAYTMNSDGQTLFFKGGGVVLIKNGVVATPGK